MIRRAKQIKYYVKLLFIIFVAMQALYKEYRLNKSKRVRVEIEKSEKK